MKIGFKIRIFPTKKQSDILINYCKTYMQIYNYLVNKYKKGEFPTVNSFGILGYKVEDLIKDCNVDIPKRIALGAMKEYAYNLRRFFDIPRYSPPKLKEKEDGFYVASQTYKISEKGINLLQNRVPKMKFEKIKVDWDDLNKREINSVIEPHFKIKNNKWILSGCYEKEDVIKKDLIEIIGMDWGIKNFMTLSTGETINYPKTLLREFQRINKLRSILSKKERGSKNFNKLNNKIEKAYRRLENIKADFIEKITTSICKEYSISVEEIVKIMRSKRFIRRQNTICPRGRFIKKLEWKAEKYGQYFLKVNPYNTSKKCSCCGNIQEDLTLDDRVYICQKCGTIIDRDINAALNIKKDAEIILASMNVCGIQKVHNMDNSLIN